MILVPDYNPTTSMKGVVVELMTEEVDAGVLSIVMCPSPGIRNHTFTIIVNSDTEDTELTAGTLQLETASKPDQPGNWSPIGSGPIDLTDITVTDDNGVMELQFSEVIMNSVRGRIVDAVTGGTVTLQYNGQ